ncbi:hypothetical protein GCM10009557_71400 [Virgisporangium ochraceum]|uniref:Uncharacterized protein n=1 Tax=Virgisporangium ochraceum TaxID=65505 RepID=A0A8J4EBT6_9ACTN|nr:hypothetical protein [Virgisporangium ochraceum]GIJ69026.1 hypothetical protein Voc01_039430 [Virgisporangium ochraceum]
MNDPHIAALLWVSTMPERDRRTTDATAGRLFAGMARAIRRLRGRRKPAQPARSAVLQTETSLR